jgi:probable HAF family extracellular repeat protein
MNRQEIATKITSALARYASMAAIVGAIITASAAIASAGLYSISDLATLGGDSSAAYSINDSGQAVGWANTAAGDQHAALFSNGTVTDLNSLINAASGWILIGAYGINNAGQIVGIGTINGEQHAFLMTVDPVTPTPIPAALALFGSGVALVGMLRRRRLISN